MIPVPGKRIALTTWGSFGDLHPYMALALELGRRGHRAVIGTMPVYREKIERAGIEFFPVRPDAPAFDSDPELLARAIAPWTGPAVIMGELLMPHLRENYEDSMALIASGGGADLLVTHVLAFGAHVAAETTGVRWLSTALSPMVLVSAYDPSTPPFMTWLRRASRLHPAIARGIIAFGRRASAPWVSGVPRLRRELGLSPRGHPIFDSPYSPGGTLAMYSPLFGQVQPDFPPRTRVTGFAFHDTDEALGGVTPEMESFLEECDAVGEAPILFTLGSSAVWTPGEFFKTAAETMRRMKRRALLLVGNDANRKGFDLPAGVRAFGYAPYSWLMPRCAVIVHQAGVGTTAQGLRAGRPLLAMPFGHDTLDNARRAEQLGVGRTLTRKRFATPNLLRELSVLLEDPVYTGRASDVGRRIRAEDGTRTACDAIEEMLRAG